MVIKKIGSLWRCKYNGTDFIAPTIEELMKIIYKAKRIDSFWRCNYNGADFIAPTIEELVKIIYKARIDRL